MKISFSEYKHAFSTQVNRLKTIPWNLGKHVFLFIILLVLLDILAGEALFYQYVFLANMKNPDVPLSSFKFQENVYNSILKEWDIDAKNVFSDLSEESNPFQPPIIKN